MIKCNRNQIFLGGLSMMRIEDCSDRSVQSWVYHAVDSLIRAIPLGMTQKENPVYYGHQDGLKFYFEDCGKNFCVRLNTAFINRERFFGTIQEISPNVWEVKLEGQEVYTSRGTLVFLV